MVLSEDQSVSLFKPKAEFAPIAAQANRAEAVGNREASLMKIKAAAVLLILSLASCASVDNSTQKNMARSILEDQRRHEAELRDEVNGPPMAPADYKRMMVALAFKRERAQVEEARYAKFQMDQKIALAQASSPKMLITNGNGDIPSDYRQVQYGDMRGHRELSSIHRHAGSGFAGGAYSVVQGSSGGGYPARFYRRQIQEDSATQAEAAYNANNPNPDLTGQQIDPEAPYAIPVPGRPGYVTMPPKMGGYIDVRGYAPGAMVMDPWTKTVIKVP